MLVQPMYNFNVYNEIVHELLAVLQCKHACNKCARYGMHVVKLGIVVAVSV